MSHSLRKNAAIALGLLLFASAASRVEAKGVVLASEKLPPAGTRIASVEDIEMPAMALQVESGKSGIPGTVSQTQHIVATLTVLSPDKLRLDVAERTAAGEVSLSGQGEVKPHVETLLKETPVVMERIGARWKVSPEKGGNLSQAQSEEVFFVSHETCHNAGEDLAIYGTGDHEPGESWQIDVSKLVYFESIVSPSGTVSARFEKIETIAGVECAIIQLTFDVTGTSDNGQKLHLQGESVRRRSIATGIDLSAKLTARMELTTPPLLGAARISGTVKKERTTTVESP